MEEEEHPEIPIHSCTFIPAKNMQFRVGGHNQRFVPSSEGQVGVVLAEWGASVVPELHVREMLATGQLCNLAPERMLPVELYWHCWNLDSVLLDNLTRALANAASQVLAN